MRTKDIGIALVGTGDVAHLYAKAFKELPEVRYLGGSNRTTEGARTFADQHGGEAFATLDAILADDRVDAVAVTTTKDNHVAPAIACLEAGKHVLLEKPVAPTIADMYLSGQEAAARVLSVRPDAKRAVCFHNAPGHVALDAMCRGFLDGMKDGSGAPGEVILVSFDVGVTEATVSNYFTTNPDTDALFTTDAGPAAFGAMLEVVRRENRTDDVTLVTFDVSPLLLEAVESGEAVAGIDQLMYMQGYLPAVLTRGYPDWGMIPSSDIITGPAVIDMKNIAAVKRRVLEDDFR